VNEKEQTDQTGSRSVYETLSIQYGTLRVMQLTFIARCRSRCISRRVNGVVSEQSAHVPNHVDESRVKSHDAEHRIRLIGANEKGESTTTV
jgi:hypothetical protein